MKKALPTAASIFFILVFFCLHHFITNGLLYDVSDSKIYYPVFARAVQYLLAALLFKVLFKPEKIFFSGLQLFLFEIALSAGIAGVISVIDHSTIFFPQFFPFHCLVDGCIVWAVLGNMKSNRMRIGLIVSGFVLSIVFECLLTYHFYSSRQRVTDNSFKGLPSLRYRFTDSGTIQIPNTTKKYFIVCFSFNECLTCHTMTPFVEDLCRKFSSEKVGVVKINPVNTLEEVRMIDTATGCLKTLVPDDTAAFNAQINNKIVAMPLLLVVDNRGNVLYLHRSYIPRLRDLLFTDIEKIVTR